MADAKIVLTAVDQTKAAFDSINRNMGALATQAQALPGKFGSIGVALGAAVGAMSLHSMVEMLDQLDALAERSGTSVARLSELRLAAGLTDSSMEALGLGLKKLSTNMADAIGGSKEAIAKFAAVGISPEQLRNFKTADDLFGALADKFSKYEDGALKNALATEYFGKRGEELIGTLNKGSRGLADMGEEARKLGGVFTAELARSASDFTDNLQRLKTAAEGVKGAILQDLLPPLVRLSSELVEGRKVFGSFLAALIEIGVKTSPFDTWSDGAKKSAADVARLNDEIAKLETGSKRVTENAGGAAFVSPSGSSRSAARLKAAKDELEAAKKRQDYYDSLIRNSVTGEANRLEDIFNGGKGAAPVVAKPDASGAAAELKRYTEALQRLEMAKGGLLHQTEAEKTLYEVTSGSLAKLTQGHKDNLLAMAREVDLVKQGLFTREFVRMNEDYAKATERSVEAMGLEIGMIGKSALQIQQLTAARNIDLDTQDKIIALRRKAEDEPSRRGQTEREIADLERLSAARKAALDAMMADANRIKMDWSSGMATGLAKYLDEVGNAAAQTEAIVTNSFKNAEDAMIDFAKTGRLEIGSFFAYIAEEWVRMQLRMNVFGPAAKFLQGVNWGSLFGSGGGAVNLGTVTGADMSVAFDGGGYTGNAARSGGLDGKGGFWAMMHPQETVIDHARGQSAGVQIQYAPVLNIGDNQNEAAIYRNVDMMLRNSAADLVDQLDRAGRLK